jgi:hypothetical protein
MMLLALPAHVAPVRTTLPHLHARLPPPPPHPLIHVLCPPTPRVLAHEPALSLRFQCLMRKLVDTIPLAIHLSVAVSSSVYNEALTETLGAYHGIYPGGLHRRMSALLVCTRGPIQVIPTLRALCHLPLPHPAMPTPSGYLEADFGLSRKPSPVHPLLIRPPNRVHLGEPTHGITARQYARQSTVIQGNAG